MYQDRSPSSSRSHFSKLIRRAEARALKAAEFVIVDTKANASWMSRYLNVDPERIRAFPLAIKEREFLGVPSGRIEPEGAIRVLFIGTFVPLHGIENLIDAMDILDGDTKIEFRIIGDGQQAILMERAINRWGDLNVTWLRHWHDQAMLAKEISSADICLGVFGGEGKAARVLPFKIYLYLAAGRAVVSQNSFSYPDDVPRPPLFESDSEPEELARSIRMLAQDKSLRERLSRESKKYYYDFLANRVLEERFSQLLTTNCKRSE